MATPKDSMSATLGVVILLLIVGLVIPPVVASLDGQRTQTFTQTETEVVTLSGGLTAEPTFIDGGSPQGANVTITHTDSGESNATGFVEQQQSETITIQGENVTVTVSDVIDSQEAIFQYEYPLRLGLPDGVEIFLDNITLLMVFLVFVSLAGTIFVIYGVDL